MPLKLKNVKNVLAVGSRGYYDKVSGKKWVTPPQNKNQPLHQQIINANADKTTARRRHPLKRDGLF
jgi:hypothetical protein